LKRGKTAISCIRVLILFLLSGSAGGVSYAGINEDIVGRDTLTICVLGDFMMHSGQISNAATDDSSHDFSPCLRYVSDIISSADIAIANMEFTLAGEPYSGYPQFSAPDSYAECIAEAGVDVFLAANNHIFDKGAEGAERTLKQYAGLEDKYGIRYTGLAADETDREATTPLILTSKGVSIAIVNMTYGTNLGSGDHWPKTNYEGQRSLISNALKKASTADFTLALPHWGEEYVLEHCRKQEEYALWLAENGADMIIGTHPHVVQDTQIIDCQGGRQVHVAYSLGNALSNMSAANTQLGLIAWIRIIKEESGLITVLPPEFDYIWCSRPGGFNDRYTILPVKDFLGREDLWKGRFDYDKMVRTLQRVSETTGIKDKP